MKKLVSLLIVCILLLSSVSALFPTGRDLKRLELVYRSPDASPIYFRGGLISNIYGGLPAKYSAQDGQIYFPHYYTPYGDLSYNPGEYHIYGSASTSTAFAGYHPGFSYGYPYNWQQYSQAYGQYNSLLYANAYPYSSYAYGGYGGGYGGYGNYGYGGNYNVGGFGGYSPYINGASGGAGGPGVPIYTGYGNNIYPGPFGVGGDAPVVQ